MPSDELHHGDAFSRVAEAESAEHDRGVRGKAKRAAIFKFDFGASAIVRFDLSTLRDGQVDERVFEAEAGILIDLNRTLNVAQAYDAGLRIGQGRQRQ